MAGWFEPFQASSLDDAQRERLAAHVARWGAVARDTDPLDRDRAAEAISRLYRRSRSRLEVPRFEWAASPVAGVLMATEVSKRSGSTRERPGFLTHQIEPDGQWFRHHRRRMGDEGWMSAASGPRFVREVGLDGSLAMRRAIAVATDAALRERFHPWAYDRQDRLQGDAVRTTRLETAGRALYGEDWDFVTRHMDRQVLVDRFDSQFRDFLSARVDEHVREMSTVFQTTYFREGQFDTIHAAAAMWGDVLLRRTAHRDELEPWLDVARACGPWWSFRDVAIVIDRPLVVRTDERGRPHCDEGPAMAYGDGFEVWANHGVCVPKWVITEPERLSVTAIDGERNAEVRRVMIERFGAERLVREGDAKLVDESDAGRLWRRPIGPTQRSPWGPVPEEPVAMVEVQNSTPEPDGTKRTYFLRVPPAMATARDAVAWTFGMRGSEYAPAQES